MNHIRLDRQDEGILSAALNEPHLDLILAAEHTIGGNTESDSASARA